MILTRNVIMLAGEARSGKDTSADILERKLTEKGFHVTRTYFAKALKTSLKRVFNLTDEHVFGSLKEVPMRLHIDFPEMLRRVLDEVHHGSLMSVSIHMRRMSSLSDLDIAKKITSAMVFAIHEGAQRQGLDYVVTPRQLMQWWGTEAVREGAYQDAWVDCVFTDIDMEASPHQIAIVTDARFDNEIEKLATKFNDADFERVVVIRTHRADKVNVAKHVSEAGVSDNLVDYEIENNDTLAALESKLETVLKEIL